MYDRDIEMNPYLNDTGKYAVQFARNHQIPMGEIMSHPMVRAYAEAQAELKQAERSGLWQK